MITDMIMRTTGIGSLLAKRSKDMDGKRLNKYHSTRSNGVTENGKNEKWSQEDMSYGMFTQTTGNINQTTFERGL